MSTPSQSATGVLDQSEQRVQRYVEALCEGVAQEMESDPSVFLFGLDVDDHKAIQGSTRGLLQRFGKERVFNTPLSEDAMTGVAIGGIAMTGGRGMIAGSFLGALMVQMIEGVLIAARIPPFLNGLVKGIIIIFTVLLQRKRNNS